MKNTYVFFSATIAASLVVCGASFAKTAKDCTAEWRADKAGMQSRGVTEKAYVEQCKGGDDAPTISPSPKPSVSAPSAQSKETSSSTSGKTAKDCTAEWRADKQGMQARGVTEKAYVEQCRGGESTPAAAPTKPTTSTPPVATPSTTTSTQKTAKECTAEWRADKAGMQARGTTEKAYVESCKNGSAPAAAPPEPKTTAAPAPTSKPAAPASTQAAPAQTTESAPKKPSAKNDGPTLEAGQFADEAPAKARCPTDTVVWVNLKSKIYHFAGTKSYGTTERGAYMCEKEAIAGEDRASKAEKRPQ